MNIKNIVLASLLTLASLQIHATTLRDLGYAGDLNNATAVFKWARSEASFAYAALHSGLSFNPAQESQLKAIVGSYVPGSTPAEKVKTPEEIAAEIAAAQEEADRLEKEAEKQAAEAKALQEAADKAAQDAKDAEAKAAQEAADAADAKAKAEEAKAIAEAKAKGESDAQAAADAAKAKADAEAAEALSNKAKALQFVQDIAAKVNATPYSGNLKAALHDKAPVTAGAHRSKALGRLGKDNVDANAKKVKAAKRS